MIGVVATIKVKAGMEKEFEAVAKELLAKTRANKMTDIGETAAVMIQEAAR